MRTLRIVYEDHRKPSPTLVVKDDWNLPIYIGAWLWAESPNGREYVISTAGVRYFECYNEDDE